MNRRDFHQLSLAAFGGVIAGSLAGCEPKSETPPAAPPSTTPLATTEGTAPATTEAAAPSAGESQPVSLLIDEPHVCRGLNSCKGKGKGGDNACAGQGTCASVEHTCGGSNDCKGQGGCGGKEGENACKGMGGCAVPLEHSWEETRARFEKAMQAAGKTFGPAPAKS